MSFYNTQYHAGGIKSQRKPWTAEVKAVTDMIYLAVVVLYVLKMSFDTTLFSISWPGSYLVYLRITVCVVILLKVGYTKAYSGKGWFICVLSFFAFKYSWLSTGYDFLLDTALLAIGAAGISYRRILKAGFWTELYVLLLAMMGSFTGCIQDLVYLDDGLFKHSFGIIYPTDFATHVVFLFLVGWCLYGKASHFLTVVYTTVLSVLVYHYSGSKTSTAVLIIAIIGISYIGLTEWYSQRFPAMERLSKSIDGIMVYALPFCAALMTALTFFYMTGNEIAVRLNDVLSNRMSLAQAALEKYGVTPFGTPFHQTGFGGTTTWTWALDYNFIDSSYMLIMIRYGLVTLLVVCFLSFQTSKRALQHGHREVVLMTALISVHSIMEHHLPEVAYNLLLLLPFADFSGRKYENRETSATGGRHRIAYAIGLWTGVIVFMAALLPRLVTYMKTIVDTLHLAKTQDHVTFIVIIFTCLLWTALLIRLVFRVILAVFRKVSVRRVEFFCAAVLLITLCYALMKGEQVIRQGQKSYQMLLDADASVVERLLASEEVGRLYVDHVPELYRRKFTGILNKVLSGEGLAGYQNATLITKDEEELWILMAAGYEYGELPSGHAIYTNDKEAVHLLETVGVQMEPYYYHRTTLNLYDFSIWNGLPMTEEGTLVLSGPEQSLLHGPWVTVYKGYLQVQYKFRILTPLPTDAVVATARITSDGGLHTWEQQDIRSLDFDDNGECIYSMEHLLKYNCPNMEFILSVQDGVVLELQEITYGKQESF